MRRRKGIILGERCDVCQHRTIVKPTKIVFRDDFGEPMPMMMKDREVTEVTLCSVCRWQLVRQARKQDAEVKE